MGQTPFMVLRWCERYNVWLASLLLYLWVQLLSVAGASVSSADERRKQVKAEFYFEEVMAAQMDVTALTEKGWRCLQSELVNWQHAQSEHFVLHFERKDFAKHVARLAEFLYKYMADELHVGTDRLPGRSHVFVFNTARRWDAFTEEISGPGEWAYSFVYGSDMFLQRAGARHESSEIVAHEMVHVILYRFYGRQPPLWLNEGLAQWYQEFGYSAYTGTGKSKSSPFRPLKAWYPLPDLVALKQYPVEPKEIALFYTTSKYLVGYLMLKKPPERMNEFVAALTEGCSMEKALCEVYQIGDIKYLVRDFERFVQ